MQLTLAKSESVTVKQNGPLQSLFKPETLLYTIPDGKRQGQPSNPNNDAMTMPSLLLHDKKDTWHLLQNIPVLSIHNSNYSFL